MPTPRATTPTTPNTPVANRVNPQRGDITSAATNLSHEFTIASVVATNLTGLFAAAANATGHAGMAANHTTGGAPATPAQQ